MINWTQKEKNLLKDIVREVYYDDKARYEILKEDITKLVPEKYVKNHVIVDSEYLKSAELVLSNHRYNKVRKIYKKLLENEEI